MKKLNWQEITLHCALHPGWHETTRSIYQLAPDHGLARMIRDGQCFIMWSTK